MKINKIYNENCLDTMERMPDNFIDLVVTSPPYDDLRLYKGYSFDFEPIAKMLFRKVKQGGVVVWVVGDQTLNGSESGSSFKQALYFKEVGFNLHDTMIWDKKGFRYPDATRYNNVFEYMFVLSKGKPNTFNPIEDRPNKHAGSSVARKSQTRLLDGSLKPNSAWKNDRDKVVKDIGKRFNIWSISPVAHKKETGNHPAVFPEEIAEDHILSWSNKGDVVYDPFCGSGTTPKMALLNNRIYIGSETAKEYCDIAEERLAKYR
jgi:site-specific DNA-methyltransferase (adenine-specific)